MKKNTLYVLAADIGILTVALLWGTTNAVIRDALSGITPMWFCALRFAVAFLTVAILFGKKGLEVPREKRLTITLIGMVFICAYLTGALGLVYTTAGNQSFIISMSVVLVPLAVWFYSKKFPGWQVILSVVLCLAGMSGLMLDGRLAVNIGDLLSFAAAVFVTAYILLVQKYVKDVNPYGFSCWLALGGMILALIFALALEPLPTAIGKNALIAIIYTGTIGFAMTLVIQTAAQKYTPATHVAILLSTAGVFGSAAGVIFLNEPMSWRIFIASALILAGVIIVELPLHSKGRVEE